MKIFTIITNYGKMVKFSHTLFALPFAGLSIILAILESKLIISVFYFKLFLILICMISARNAAMGFNRLVDAEIDKNNPRTKNREIPSGIISKSSVTAFIILFSIAFIISTYFLNTFAFLASVPTLLIVLFYSFTKRFTWLCHYILGFGIGLSPMGAWVAITGDISFVSFLWSMGLMFHIAGFDILYSTQDLEYDKDNGLFSIPSVFGLEISLLVAKINHTISFLLLFYAGWIAELSNFYFIFLCIAGILFAIEHFLVNKNDLSKVPIAFFHINASISIILFLGIFFEKWNDLIYYFRSQL
jgi:4-hydroxybenzoate polyprenyltransferase